MGDFIELGPRGPVKGTPDTTSFNSGNWTIVLDPSVFNVSSQIQYFEIYKMIVHGAAGTTFDVRVDINLWDTAVYGFQNSWDPIQPLKIQQGQSLYFLYSDPVSDNNPPTVTVWLRYNTDDMLSNNLTRYSRSTPERDIVYAQLYPQVSEARFWRMSPKTVIPCNNENDHGAPLGSTGEKHASSGEKRGEDLKVSSEEVEKRGEAGPVVLMSGRFRLYETPRGGYKLVYRVDGEREDRAHIDVPAAMVRAAKAMGDKGPGMMGKMFGAR